MSLPPYLYLFLLSVRLTQLTLRYSLLLSLPLSLSPSLPLSLSPPLPPSTGKDWEYGDEDGETDAPPETDAALPAKLMGPAGTMLTTLCASLVHHVDNFGMYSSTVCPQLFALN